MDIFGHTCIPRIISLDYTGTQFEIYNKISRNYEYSFLFESLTGPEELSETSIMGFDPEFVVKGYYDKVTIQGRDGSIETIVTNDPLTRNKKISQKNRGSNVSDILVVLLASLIMMQQDYGKKFQNVTIQRNL